MAAEVTEAIEYGTLLGPAVAVVPAVPNVVVASVGYATEDSSSNETGDYTADEGAITAATSFSGTCAHGYSCTDRQSGDSGGEGFLGNSVHFHSPISVARLPRLARGIAASLDDRECSRQTDRRMCGSAQG